MVDLLIKVAYFEKSKTKYFSVWKGTYLNYSVQGGQLYWAFPLQIVFPGPMLRIVSDEEKKVL
jgi:hypothetical protein